MRTCKTCRFRDGEDGGGGWCHRFPPVHVGDLVYSFPMVSLAASCGEHRFAFWRALRRLFGRERR